MIPQRAPLLPEAAQPAAQVLDFRMPYLGMPDQRLDKAFVDAAAPGARTDRRTRMLRAAVLLVPMVPAAMVGWMTQLALAAYSAPWVGPMVAFALYWIAMPVGVALLGVTYRPRAAPTGPVPALRIAILLPMYGEDAEATILPAFSLLQNLTGAQHRFCLRVLSDTRSLSLATREQQIVEDLARQHPTLDITWRRREANHDFKSGNLRDWLRAEGHRHGGALVLDADSRMGAATVLRLADELAADPATALIQTVARVAPGHSVWQRLQSFGSRVYGANLGRGFAAWTGAEGNYLGHNAIFRTAAFARCAGLPHLPGRAPRGGVILSHDFVEAAFLRRAGWGVRMLPEADDSWEEAPATLAAHIRRDRRWCQGNLQHLRLLAVPGLHPVSRLHFLQGAMAYLSSAWWLALLLAFAALPATPFQAASAGLVAVAVVTLLMAPKLLGLVCHLREQRPSWRFGVSFVAELVLSVLLAPVLMVQQTRAVLGMAMGRDSGWQPHGATRPRLPDLLRLHAVETVVGLCLVLLVATGAVTPWLSQVAASLALAAPLSWLVQRDAPVWLG